MSLKGQKTTADYLEWQEFSLLLMKLQRDKEYKFTLLIAIGTFCGLRVSDILSFKWSDFIASEKPLKIVDDLELKEKKTSKDRKIKINNDLKKIISECFLNLKPKKNQFIFIGKKKDIYSRQYVNKKLKRIKVKYKLNINNFSTHSLRKTFGRQVWKNNNYSEKALILLSEVFNHSNMQVTKRYLGIKNQEISNVYEKLSLNL